MSKFFAKWVLQKNYCFEKAIFYGKSFSDFLVSRFSAEVACRKKFSFFLHQALA
jgi:hypothetical protein